MASPKSRFSDFDGDAAPDASRSPPAVTWVYGLLGLVPFLADAAGALLLSQPGRTWAQIAILAYGALILSFLGGGRWGLEIGRQPVRPAVISASMAPTVVSFILLLLAGVPIAWRLIAMALVFLVQWAWDVRSADTPPWYPPLRHVLTIGAVGSLVAGAAASLLR